MSDAEDQLKRWDVPGLPGGLTCPLTVGPGGSVVIVGPNGSGKSALSHWLYVNSGSAAVVRVHAHRRVWLQSAGTEMTASTRATVDQNFRYWDSEASSRIVDSADSQRSSRLLFDLLGRVNGRNARVAELVDTKQDVSDVEESSLAQISGVLQAAGLKLSFKTTDQLTFNVRRNSVEYPISSMSDGEKGAFLLAAEVLLAPPGCVQIIDEPERHLHRSISAQLIAALARSRPDCGFVFLTHDLDLISRLDPDSTVVCVVNGVEWSGETAVGWDLRIEPSDVGLPDSARKAILGGRDRLLFVEGDASSLDAGLYDLIFAAWSVVPCGGADDVKRAVHGLGTAGDYHWVDARGVLDGDARTSEEASALAAKHILVLPVNEIESLYYLSWVVDAIAERQAKALAKDGPTLAAAAKTDALASLGKSAQRQHLAAANAEKSMRRSALAQLPSRDELKAGDASAKIEVPSEYNSQLVALNAAINAMNYDEILYKYSARDSGMLNAVATALCFRERADYEAAVRVFLAEDTVSLAKLIAFVEGQAT